MPNCPTKSFAAFLCLRRALLSVIRPGRAIRSPKLPRRVRSAPRRLASWAVRLQSVRASALAKLRNNAKTHATPTPIAVANPARDPKLPAHPTRGPAHQIRDQVHQTRSRAHRIHDRVPQTRGQVRRIHDRVPQIRDRAHRIRDQDLRTRDRILRTRLHGRNRTRLLVGFCLFIPLLASAQNAASDAFERGRIAFERQDFASALEAFETAVANGQEGPAVHYNIGVAAYRLQQYDKARAAFERVSQTPTMAGLALYNLGLVALAENDEQRAIDAFALAYEVASDDRIRSLALTQLESIGEKPRETTTLALYASSGVGYDDNVTLTTESQALGITREADLYGETFLVGQMQLTNAWRLEGDVSYLNYADLDDFDQWSIGAGGRYRFGLAAWALDAGVHVGTTYVDGERFDVRESAYLQAQRALASDLWLRARYRLSNVEPSDDYPGLDGLRHEWMTRLIRRGMRWMVGAGYTFESSDYASDALSAVRHQVGADVRASLTQRWTANASLTYRHSEYDDATIGAEARVELGAGAELALTNRWTIAMRYLYTNNDADTATYTYRRSRVFVGVDVTF